MLATWGRRKSSRRKYEEATENRVEWVQNCRAHFLSSVIDGRVISNHFGALGEISIRVVLVMMEG